jgi:transposase
VITIGVDAHKQVHAAVAVDGMGREIAQWRGANAPTGWQALVTWAGELGEPVQWGIEGAWGYGRGLAQCLVAAGATVYDVTPRLTAAGRRRARRPAKTDRLDAQAVARAVQQEQHLPAVTADDETAVLDLLVTERDDLLAEATRLRNRLHQVLLQVDATYQARLPKLRTKAGLRAAEAYPLPDEDGLGRQRVEAVRRLAQRLRLVVEQAKALAEQIEARARPRWAALTEVCGVDLLTAGALAGLLGPGQRFRTEAQVAAFAGVAPLETSSAGHVRHRLNRGGNRRLNCLLYRIALTQARYSPAAQAYLARRQAEGKSWREAIRALKRFICRALWRRWQECLAQPTPTSVLLGVQSAA